MSEKKIYKNVFQIVVLSEDAPVSNCDLGVINFDITEGDCSGEVKHLSSELLTPKEAADALLDQGSDPSFFGLTPDGKDMNEEQT